MRGSSGAYDVAIIDDERPRVCGTPAKNVDGLAASQAMEGEGKGRGARWLFIEGNGAALDGQNQRDLTRGEIGARAWSLARFSAEEDDDYVSW
jgi:hypothetical protein